MTGIREFWRGMAGVLFLVLVVWVWDFPKRDPQGEEFPGEIWDACGGRGEFGHLYEGRFCIAGR